MKFVKIIPDPPPLMYRFDLTAVEAQELFNFLWPLTVPSGGTPHRMYICLRNSGISPTNVSTLHKDQT